MPKITKWLTKVQMKTENIKVPNMNEKYSLNYTKITWSQVCIFFCVLCVKLITKITKTEKLKYNYIHIKKEKKTQHNY